MNCPLSQQIGCAYGKNLKCPEDYLLCSFYMLYENETVLNYLARLEIRASELEESLTQQELKMRENSKQ